jgi:hypothetical protein
MITYENKGYDKKMYQKLGWTIENNGRSHSYLYPIKDLAQGRTKETC